MRKILLGAAAAFGLAVTAFAGSADAQCWRAPYGWECSHGFGYNPYFGYGYYRQDWANPQVYGYNQHRWKEPWWGGSRQ